MVGALGRVVAGCVVLRVGAVLTVPPVVPVLLLVDVADWRVGCVVAAPVLPEVLGWTVPVVCVGRGLLLTRV